MGIGSRRAPPPLPAPTESESFDSPAESTELGDSVDEGHSHDDISSFSLPDDGTPVTIKTRGHKPDRSQTSLLIEYFEGSRSPTSPEAGECSSRTQRKPSVRVRLTPSTSRGKGDHIQITETKSTSSSRRRTTSLSRRALGDLMNHHNQTLNQSEISHMDQDDDTRSMNSYTSATEESNVSRNPIEVEIAPGASSSHRRRERKASSPLIPAVDSKVSSFLAPNINMSEISAIPSDSFLDGSGNTPDFSRTDKRSKSPTRSGEMLAAGALGVVTAAAIADKMNRKQHRSESHDRRIVEKVERASASNNKPERRHKSRNRNSGSSCGDKELKDMMRDPKDPDKGERRRSKGGSSNKESAISAGATDMSALSQLSPSHRSYDSHTSSRMSINNPKLLETVEDAIRRLILPELDAIKRERSQRETSQREGRRNKDRDSLSSLTTASKEDISSVGNNNNKTSNANKRRSVDTTASFRSRGREARNELSPLSSPERGPKIDDDFDEHAAQRGKERTAEAAAILGMATAAEREKSRVDEKRQRRRRRAKTPERHRAAEEFEELERDITPPMPLSSEINASDLTRTSILSAESERPPSSDHSASEEMAPPLRGAPGASSTPGLADEEPGTPTPTRTPLHTLQSLGAQHANISHGDLKALPRQRTGDLDKPYDESDLSQGYGQESAHDGPQDEFEYDYEDAEHMDENDMGPDFYHSQDVPPPLRYVPYQQERRGLSPIQSVSGYTESSEAPRDSRITQSDMSPPATPSNQHRGPQSPNSMLSNMRSREFGDDQGSLRDSANYRNTTYTEDSEMDHLPSGQAVRPVGANPQFVHPNLGPESVVASLVDGSQLSPSLMSGSHAYRDSHMSSSVLSGARDSQLLDPSILSEAQEYRDSQLSYDEAGSPDGKSPASRDESPSKRSLMDHHDGSEHESTRSKSVQSKLSRSNATASPRHSPQASPRASPRSFMEYEINEHGQKVPTTKYRQSPTTSESAITRAALTRAAAATLKAKEREYNQSPSVESATEEQFVGEGVSRNRSFKERAKTGYRPDGTPRHSIDRLSDDYAQMGADGMPNMEDPYPEMGYFDDRHSTPSVVQGRLGGSRDDAQSPWQEGDATPTREDISFEYDDERSVTPQAGQGAAKGLGIAAASALAAAGAMANSHSRQPSQDQDEEWRRTSGERKRDTLVTNPYEGTSPVANLPGVDSGMLNGGGYGGDGYRGGFNTGSPSLPQGDEGYISAAPNETREGLSNINKGQLTGPNHHGDPFYAVRPTNNTRHLSGMSQGMGSPMYDASMGMGMDRIESKDVIALMEHLMVRDAQRSARDTELLVTLVRSAAEMRTSFNDIKRMLADTEDQIIGEVKDNTDKTVLKHLGGPRPLPGSAARSIQGGSQTGGTFEDLPTKKRNLFRRALKGLGAKGSNDLGKIEDMLMQLLGEVEVLKHQTAAPAGTSAHNQSMENLQPEGQYEQDRGYEPEGHAGTSTASHASHSGHLSLTQPRVAQPTQLGMGMGMGMGSGSGSGMGTGMSYERKFSDHRISTVPEGNEDDYSSQHTRESHDSRHYSNPDIAMSPALEPSRAGSVPLATPPRPSVDGGHVSISNENTPLADTSKKHRSKGSSGFFPKISRWSETTTSSLGKVFQRSSVNSRKTHETADDFASHSHPHPPSRSVSDLGTYDTYSNTDPHGADYLHTGFSQQDLSSYETDTMPKTTPPEVPLVPLVPNAYGAPEDPKYKVHRNSINLQHPQPRQGQTERFRTALETSAQDYDTPMSPSSANWAGSATSLHRFPTQQHNTKRYSDTSTQDYYSKSAWSPSPAQAPPRPPKEPLDTDTPPRNDRVNQLLSGGEGGASPRTASASGTPARRPSGPRAMTPSRASNRSRGSDIDELGSPRSMRSGGDTFARDERRRKRDTFGSPVSQDSETF